MTRLTAGQTVDVQVEAVPGLRVAGVVERIAPQATIKNNVKGFAARILLKNVDKRIRPGMTANIKIPVASAESVLAVPLAAVFTDIHPETGETDRYVFVKNGNRPERRPVRIGVTDYFHAEIQQGLEAGEVVFLELPPGTLQAAKTPASSPGSGSRTNRTTGERTRPGSGDARRPRTSS